MEIVRVLSSYVPMVCFSRLKVSARLPQGWPSGYVFGPIYKDQLIVASSAAFAGTPVIAALGLRKLLWRCRCVAGVVCVAPAAST